MTTATYEPVQRTAPAPTDGSRRASDRAGLTSSDGAERLARGLGWFSIGLGAAELASPRRIAELIGIPYSDPTGNALRAMGLREIASGIGILARPDNAGRVWTRVAGDAIDLTLLGAAFNGRSADRGRLSAATAAVALVTLIDVVAGRSLAREAERREGGGRCARGIDVIRTLTVNRPADEVYRFWRHLENLPRFMAHLESVTVQDDRRSHWKARAPAGATAEWDAEIVEDSAGELIAWRSLEGATVPNHGAVRFTPAPGNRGTEIRVELSYQPPAGAVGAAIAKLFGEEPGQQVEGDLRRFKQVMETGEVVRSDASIHPGRHPARPATGAALDQARADGRVAS